MYKLTLKNARSPIKKMLNKFEYLASSRSFTHTVCFFSYFNKMRLSTSSKKLSTRVFRRVSTAYTHILDSNSKKRQPPKCKKTSSSLKTKHSSTLWRFYYFDISGYTWINLTFLEIGVELYPREDLILLLKTLLDPFISKH